VARARSCEKTCASWTMQSNWFYEFPNNEVNDDANQYKRLLLW
jgi:hypothetical protein